MSTVIDDSDKDKKSKMETNIQRNGIEVKNKAEKLDLSNQKEIRILVDFKSFKEHGMGAPESSLQMLNGIRETTGFNGKFVLIPIGIGGHYDLEGLKKIKEKLAEKHNYGTTEIMDVKEYDSICQQTLLRRGPTCEYGFTGSYDYDSGERSQRGNLVYENGVGCSNFITLSSPGWHTRGEVTREESKGKLVQGLTKDLNYTRAIPSAWSYTQQTRRILNTNVPRRDVLILSPEEIEALQQRKFKSFSSTSSSAGASANNGVLIKVMLYKLDQDKNTLQSQRKVIIESLFRYSHHNDGKIIDISDFLHDFSKKTKEEQAVLIAKEKSMMEVFQKQFPNARVRWQPVGNMPAEKYHQEIAASNVVFCEGQNTGSQAMLYGTCVVHLPLPAQGVNIHRSNEIVAGMQQFDSAFDSKVKSHNNKMASFCEVMGERQKQLSKDVFNECIDYTLSEEGQKNAIVCSQQVRSNTNLDMLTQVCAIQNGLAKEKKPNIDMLHQLFVIMSEHGNKGLLKKTLEESIKKEGNTLRDIFPNISGYLDPAIETYMIGTINQLRLKIGKNELIQDIPPLRIQNLKKDVSFLGYYTDVLLDDQVSNAEKNVVRKDILKYFNEHKQLTGLLLNAGFDFSPNLSQQGIKWLENEGNLQTLDEAIKTLREIRDRDEYAVALEKSRTSENVSTLRYHIDVLLDDQVSSGEKDVVRRELIKYLDKHKQLAVQLQEAGFDLSKLNKEGVQWLEKEENLQRLDNAVNILREIRDRALRETSDREKYAASLERLSTINSSAGNHNTQLTQNSQPKTIISQFGSSQSNNLKSELINELAPLLTQAVKKSNLTFQEAVKYCEEHPKVDRSINANETRITTNKELEEFKVLFKRVTSKNDVAELLHMKGYIKELIENQNNAITHYNKKLEGWKNEDKPKPSSSNK